LPMRKGMLSKFLREAIEEKLEKEMKKRTYKPQEQFTQ